MKAWTLIAFYLWKDIWSRWLETPGAVLARLLVAVLLGGLMLLVQTAFTLAGRSLEARIARMGAGTLFVTEAVAGEATGAAPLGGLLAPLAARAELVTLRQVSTPARDELGADYTVMLYGPETLPALAPLLAAAPRAPAHVLAANLPTGMALNINVGGRDYAAVTLRRPAWFDRFAFARPVVLLPAEADPDGLQLGYIEIAMVVAPDRDTASLRALAAAIRSLLFLENRPTAQVQSPEGLLAELDGLRATQHRWQTAAGLLGGIVVALVFGSIAILEYRQNRFIVALLRSFGTPAPLLLLRYAVEALLLVSLAVVTARWVLIGLHGAVFALAGLEPSVLDRGVVDPYAWEQVWQQARWLGLGAALSVAPIALSLRVAVGRVLQ